MAQTEAQFQAKFIKKLKERFPGCVIMKNDSGYQQGIPDWTILYGPKWATLEIKARTNAPRQPNQEYFVKLMGDMSFSALVYPENEEATLSDLERAFAS